MKLACSNLYISQPTAIIHGPLGIPKQPRQSIIQHFLKEKQDEQDVNPNVGWRTNNYAHLDNDILNPILDQIHLFYCNNVVGPRGPKMITDFHWQNTNNLEVDAEVWFQELLPGQGCPMHEHGTLSRYSWVYYLDVNEDATPLTFVETKANKNEISPVDETHLPVYNDLIVMFPSMILHKVNPVQTKRYILAGNINDICYKEPQ